MIGIYEMIRIDGLKFKEMLQGGAKALEMNRAIVDELNVFPVPDGDTGTNMSLTLASAVREANACGSLLIDEIALAFSKGALVQTVDDLIYVELFVVLKIGVNIEAVKKSLADAVKFSLETFTGMRVKRVHVNVVGIRV